MMGESEYKYECGWCPQRRNCEWAFGKYWHQRSNGAKGCNISFGDMGKAKAANEPKPAKPAEPAEPKRETLKLQAESVKQPWEIAHVTKGRSAGIYCSSKRNNFGKTRQEVLCLR